VRVLDDSTRSCSVEPRLLLPARPGSVRCHQRRHRQGTRAGVDPDFRPNLVSGLMGAEEKTRLDADPLKPWINRRSLANTPPARPFKAVTALASLHEKATGLKEKFLPRHYTLGTRRGAVTRTAVTASGHREALIVSCDVYFYTMGSRITITPWRRWRGGSLRRRTGIPLSNEQPGLVPDEAYHNRADRATGVINRGMWWNTSIGQGSLLVTPLQLAMALRDDRQPRHLVRAHSSWTGSRPRIFGSYDGICRGRVG